MAACLDRSRHHDAAAQRHDGCDLCRTWGVARHGGTPAIPLDRAPGCPSKAGAVLDLLHAPRFADQAPAEIYATLLDEGIYHCSIRTMYRLLGQNGESRERRTQLRHPVSQKPE